MTPISTSTSIHGSCAGRAGAFSIFEAIDACAKAGFTHVDISLCAWWGQGMPLAEADYLRFGDQIGECLARCGLSANQAHAPFYLHGVSAEEDAFNARQVERSLEIAGRLGVPWIVMHILRVRDIGTDDKRVGMERNVAYFKPYGELARRYGVGIAIENGLTGFFHSADELLELLDRLRDNAFGLCWDTGHANITGQDQPAAIRKMGARLKALHLNDNDGLKDQHLLPFMGKTNFPPLMEALRGSGFQGVATLESGGFTRGLPQTVRSEALRFAAAVCRSLG